MTALTYTEAVAQATAALKAHAAAKDTALEMATWKAYQEAAETQRRFLACYQLMRPQWGADILEHLLQATVEPNMSKAAEYYWQAGLSVLPLVGKKPALRSWIELQETQPNLKTFRRWQDAGLFQNVGIICGAVSGNLVVIDLDGLNAVKTFRNRFRDLLDTYTVQTGSGQGEHLYYQVVRLPRTTREIGIPGGGNVEVRVNGCYVAAPPSIHPDTQRRYCTYRDKPIKRLADLDMVLDWLATFSARSGSKGSAVRSGNGRTMKVGAYAAAALRNEAAGVKLVAEGYRNNRLNLAAYNLGQLVGDSHLAREEVESVLLSAALAVGLPEGESLRTIKSGLDAGIAKPRSRR